MTFHQQPLGGDIFHLSQTYMVTCLVELLFSLWMFQQSLKKKVEILQRMLSTPTRTNEAISRLVFERYESFALVLFLNLTLS